MSNQLPATTKSKTLMPAPLLDAKLNALVQGNDSPIVGPISAAALRAYAAQPEPETATREQVEVMIGKLAIGTAQAKVSAAEAEERLNLYWLALNDIPLVDLREGFTKLLRTATFLPTPAEVRKAALFPGLMRRHLKGRAKFLAWKHEQEWAEPVTEYVSAAELQSILPSRKDAA